MYTLVKELTARYVARIYNTMMQRYHYNVLQRKHNFFMLPLIMVLFFSQTACFANSNLPDLGSASSPTLSPIEEMELGRSILGEIERSLHLYRDNITNEYLASIGYRVIATFSHAQNNFRFFTVLDPRINAFALPGGFIGINSGLILAAETESELAGVIAHEVAHVKQRHIARMYEHMGRIKLSTIAGLIASVILATQNPEAGTGALAATLAGSQQAMINFTREHEREADSIGIQALAKAGYDPMGMPSFFHRMQQDARFYGRWMPEYLLTHPLSSERLIVSKSRAEQFPYKQIPDSQLFHLVRARIYLASATTPQESTRYFQQALAKGTHRNKIGTLYGLALSLLQEGQPEKADIIIEELLRHSANEPLFLLAKAQVKTKQKDFQGALALLRTSLQSNPKHNAITVTLAELLISQNQNARAIRVIKKHMHFYPHQPELYMLLSSAYTKSHKPVKAHLAQAQALKLYGEHRSALRQLQMARKLSSITEREIRQINAKISEIKPYIL